MHSMDIRNLSIGQMEVFLKAAEFGSFTKAGAALFIEQSTVSKNIRSLENMLGLQLFIREKKTVRLTPAGMKLYDRWKELASKAEEAVVEAHFIQTGYAGSIKVVGLDTYKPEALILPLINHFKKKYPAHPITVETMPAEEVRRMLINGEADAAFTVLYDIEQLGMEEFSAQTLVECPHVAMMLPSNPLAQRKSLKVEDLRNCNFISISPMNTPSYSVAVEQLCKEHGFIPNITYYTHNAGSLPFNLTTDKDVFICDRFYKDFGNSGFRAIPIEDTKSGVVIGWKKANVSEALRIFVRETLTFISKHPKMIS